MDLIKLALILMIFDQIVVESFRIGELKRGGSNPSRAFLLLREFQKLQQRLHHNRQITVSQRHELPKNWLIFDKDGQKSAQSQRNKSRIRFFGDFHNFSSKTWKNWDENFNFLQSSRLELQAWSNHIGGITLECIIWWILLYLSANELLGIAHRLEVATLPIFLFKLLQ